MEESLFVWYMANGTLPMPQKIAMGYMDSTNCTEWHINYKIRHEIEKEMLGVPEGRWKEAVRDRCHQNTL